MKLTAIAICIPGLIRLHVLHHAAEEPIFGLGMIEELARHGYRISPGSLYPLLHGLEKKGYLRSTEVAQRQVPAARCIARRRLDGRRWQQRKTKCANCFVNSSKANSRVRPNRSAAPVCRWLAAVLRRSRRRRRLDAERRPSSDALRNYPSIRVSQEQINAAAAGIQLARTAYLPRIDALAQVNRATRNNVFGLLLPQSVIPSISGPVLGTNNFGTAWGSAIGALVTWEPFDFGLRARRAWPRRTRRGRESEAALKRTQFEVAVAAADAYLTLVAAQETVRAAQAGVDRAEVLAANDHALW